MFPETLAALLLALIVDALVGDPDPVWRRLPHPVVLFGHLIDVLDRKLNLEDAADGRRRGGGVLAVLVLLCVAAGIGIALQMGLSRLPFGDFAIGLLASILIAQRGLYEHVAIVRDALLADGLKGGREAVAKVVGRDPDRLNESGIVRAATESLAENFSDAVVAPAFWFAIFGLPGLLAYKALNTADSMIGHRNARYSEFGWAAARLDDTANLVPARLSALVIAGAALLADRAAAKKALRTALRDARKHRSPNAGWPEAAFAGALDIALAGPRVYAGVVIDDDFVNDSGKKELADGDLNRALGLFAAASVFHAGIYAVLMIGALALGATVLIAP
ncbi:adenosylcobinamide-phosphate synthase [Rhodobium orientis]|uniref:Cobalamin biosynthesis protein CobD n=1 Tax=Rhodobium orientis TaxID=34017 RepID=A0A327JU58_9HYPH|nr:adenosylcobinamide-phosphate synthase CbiB [Rhodobium orientis]MBB4302576.1 adenosylcobinamide-phosphate synthase [Rhodobium orientis]MBK5949424.1 cobalamin biosynthesis protein [Rhodobium orientis]RAI29145.1 cobalamin biosynthesis protein [Rhodobium orientis]